MYRAWRELKSFVSLRVGRVEWESTTILDLRRRNGFHLTAKYSTVSFVVTGEKRQFEFQLPRRVAADFLGTLIQFSFITRMGDGAQDLLGSAGCRKAFTDARRVLANKNEQMSNTRKPRNTKTTQKNNAFSK